MLRASLIHICKLVNIPTTLIRRNRVIHVKRDFVTDAIPQFSQFYGFLQPKLKATSHKPSLGSKVLNLLTRNTYKTYSPEDTGEIFQKCKNLTQLKNSVNRLFYKYHTPKEGTIISALKACTRLISLNNKNDTTQLVPINRIEGDLSKYWIETPECPSYTVSEVLEVASYIFESLDPSRKTIPICNAYIRVFGSAKRIDLAFAFFNQMRRSNSRRPNVYTYKALISCCVDALDLESAYAVIEDSTKLVLQDAKDTSNWFYHARNLGLGMIVAKCLAISYLIISRDLDLLEPLGGIEIDKIAIAGIGIGTILCARVAMLRLFEPQMETPRQTHDLYSASISHNEFLKMSSQEIRNYMYSYLIFRLLFKSHFNEALVVVHHMAKNEIPLAIETYNGVINLMCKIERIGLALEAIERFQEHGIKPNAGTFLPIYNALRMQSSEEFLRLHRLMRTNNVYI